jgi:hypothetical protein
MIRVLEFETRYRGETATDWVLVAPSGESMQNVQTWHRVDKLNPHLVPEGKREGISYADMRMKWEVIGPKYDGWKADADVPETGTPLAAWAGVTPEQARMMQSLDLRTVEDVASATESHIKRLPFPSARKLKQLAADFLAGRDGAATAQALADAQDRIAAMEEMLNEQMAQANDTPKRRGRPPKAEAAEHEEAA